MTPYKFADLVDEVSRGIGNDWAKYPVYGATRDGLAIAKERVGKAPGRYKPVTPGTIFYNPMRILIGSIAMLDDDDPPGITSPDYVVMKPKDGLLDYRWFYHWFRSPFGQHFIASLARGAVRERILFNRLAAATLAIPDYRHQVRASKVLREVRVLRRSTEKQLTEIDSLAQAAIRSSVS